MRRSVKSGATWMCGSKPPRTSSRARSLGTGWSAIAQLLEPAAGRLGHAWADAELAQERGGIGDLVDAARGVVGAAADEPGDRGGVGLRELGDDLLVEP